MQLLLSSDITHPECVKFYSGKIAQIAQNTTESVAKLIKRIGIRKSLVRNRIKIVLFSIFLTICFQTIYDY